MYIHALRGGVISVIIFAALSFLIPGIGTSEEISLLLTVSTFLFAILAGFLIARMNSRYDGIRESTGNEDTGSIHLFKLTKNYNEKIAEKVAGLIDKIYLVYYDHWITPEAYQKNEKIFYKIYDLFKGAKGRSEDLYIEIMEELDDIKANRRKIQNLLEETVSNGQWVVMIALAFIIIFCLFYMNTALVYNLTTIILSTTLIMVLLLVRDLNNLMLGGKLLLQESGEEVFEQIGKPVYYNHYYIDSGLVKIKEDLKEYRLGMHKIGEEPKIKLVRNESKENK